MRVELETVNLKPTGIWPFRTPAEYQVHLRIMLSEEESTIVRKHDLKGLVVFRIPVVYDGVRDESLVFLRDLIGRRPYVRKFSSPVDAQIFENKLKTSTLPNLKKYLDVAGQAKQKAETFEL